MKAIFTLLIIFFVIFSPCIYAEESGLAKIFENKCAYQFVTGLLCEPKPIGRYSEICIVKQIAKNTIPLVLTNNTNIYLGLSISFRNLPEKDCTVEKTGNWRADIANEAVQQFNTAFSAIADYHVSTFTIGKGKTKLQSMRPSNNNKAEEAEIKSILNQVVQVLRQEKPANLIKVLPATKSYLDGLKDQSLHPVDIKNGVGEYESTYGFKSRIYKVSNKIFGDCLVVFEKLEEGIFINIFPVMHYGI